MLSHRLHVGNMVGKLIILRSDLSIVETPLRVLLSRWKGTCGEPLLTRDLSEKSSEGSEIILKDDDDDLTRFDGMIFLLLFPLLFLGRTAITRSVFMIINYHHAMTEIPAIFCRDGCDLITYQKI